MYYALKEKETGQIIENALNATSLNEVKEELQTLLYFDALDADKWDAYNDCMDEEVSFDDMLKALNYELAECDTPFENPFTEEQPF